MTDSRELDIFRDSVNRELKMARDTHKEIIDKFNKVFGKLDKLNIQLAKVETNSKKLDKIDSINDRLIKVENSDKGFKKMIPVVIAIALVIIERMVHVL